MAEDTTTAPAGEETPAAEPSLFLVTTSPHIRSPESVTRIMWAVVLAIGVAPGIAEELLFRGYIQTRFSQRWGVGWGVLWTALLFGVMHLDFIHGVFAFALGVYLGYLTEWTGSIVPAMICHAANNTYQTLATAWGLDVTGDAANVAALIVGVTILCCAIWHLRARVRPKGSDPS